MGQPCTFSQFSCVETQYGEISDEDHFLSIEERYREVILPLLEEVGGLVFQVPSRFPSPLKDVIHL